MNDFILNYPIIALLTTALILMLLPLAIFILLTVLNKVGHKTKLVAYISCLVPPLLWLMAPLILAESHRPNMSHWRAIYNVLRLNIADWFMLPISLIFLVFLWYVLMGIEESQAYKDIFKPRKSVWIVFGVFVIFVIWFVPSILLQTQAKFGGSHINLTYEIEEALEDVTIDAGRLGPSWDCARLKEYYGEMNGDCDALTIRYREGNETYLMFLMEQIDALESSLSLLQVSTWTANLELLHEPAQSVNEMAVALAEAGEEELTAETADTVLDKLDETAVAATEAQNALSQLTFAATVAGIEGVTNRAGALKTQFDEEIVPQIDVTKQLVEAVTEADDDAKANAVEDARRGLAELVTAVGTTTDPAKGSVVHSANALSQLSLGPELNSGFDDQSQSIILSTVAQMQVNVEEIKAQANQLNYSSYDSAHDWRVNEIQDKVRGLNLAAAALQFEVSTPLLMVALLFIVFLFLPWLLYISFIVRKRVKIINDRLDLLKDLNLLDRFRTGSRLSQDLTIEGALKAREIVLSTHEAPENRVEGIGGDWHKYAEASLACQKLIQPDTNNNGWKIRGDDYLAANQEEILRLADTEILNRQTFHSREYLIPLLILTALTLVGWYYTFFARGTNGLVRFIEQGGGIDQLSNLLAQFTPLTMVFAGAWLFMIIMLTYRWVSNDLYPRSFFYASMRLVYGLLVGMVFLALFGEETDRYWLLLAFFVGTAPLEFVNALWKSLKNAPGRVTDWISKDDTNHIVEFFERPNWASRQPLTDLEDITVWDDTRFYQEGIQNVHALATADLARLVVRTPYDAQTLVDWVDQAILRIHTKVLWHSGMVAIGIRGATDLLDNSIDDEGKQSAKKVARVVNAFNAAQLMSIGTSDPRFEAYNEASELEKSGEALAEDTKAVKEVNSNLDPEKAETLDNIVSMRQQVNKLKDKAKAARDARQPVADALIGIVGADAEPWTADQTLAQKLEELVKSDGLIVGAENSVKEDTLTRQMLADDLPKDAEADKPGQTALKKAQEAIKELVEPAEKAKEVVENSVKQIDNAKKVQSEVDALQTAVNTLIEATKTANDNAQALTPETFATEKDNLLTALDNVIGKSTEAENSVQNLLNAKQMTGEIESQTKDLQAKLSKDQLQKKIKDVLDAVKQEVPNVEDVKKQVTEIVTAVGSINSTGKDTISGLMKDVAKIKKVGELLEAGINSVIDLHKAIETVNTLAQSIKKDDATTWDNVKALSTLLSNLTKSANDAEEKRSSLKSKLDAQDRQQTLALREAQKKVEDLATSTKDAKEKTVAAEKAFQDEEKGIALSADSGKSDLLEAKEKATTAVTATESLATGIDEAAEKAMQTVMPLRLTTDILEVMLGAMARDPNIHYIQHFWQRQVERIKEN